MVTASIFYNRFANVLFSVFAIASFMQKWSVNVSSMSCSLWFLCCICNILFNCAFILSFVCCGCNLCSYLSLFGDCQISNSIICIVIVNLALFLFVFGMFILNRCCCGV